MQSTELSDRQKKSLTDVYMYLLRIIEEMEKDTTISTLLYYDHRDVSLASVELEERVAQ